jgi:hypothetical protein
MFKDTQMKHLLESGFKEKRITTQVIDNQPPSDCDYYATPKMIAPTIYKL